MKERLLLIVEDSITLIGYLYLLLIIFITIMIMFSPYIVVHYLHFDPWYLMFFFCTIPVGYLFAMAFGGLCCDYFDLF